MSDFHKSFLLLVFSMEHSYVKNNVYRSSVDMNLEGGIMIGKGSREGSQIRITSNECLALKFISTQLVDSGSRMLRGIPTCRPVFFTTIVLRTFLLNELSHDDYMSAQCCQSRLFDRRISS